MKLSMDVSQGDCGSRIHVDTSSAPSFRSVNALQALTEVLERPGCGVFFEVLVFFDWSEIAALLRESFSKSRHCWRFEHGFRSTSAGVALLWMQSFARTSRSSTGLWMCLTTQFSWTSAGTFNTLGNISALRETLHCYSVLCSHIVSAVINVGPTCNRPCEHCAIFTQFITYL